LAQSESVLTPEAYDLFRSDNETRKNVVVMLLTSDDSGYPRVALLSPYQILAIDNKHLFVNVYRGSKTNRNLLEKKKATLVVVTPPSMQYIKVSEVSHSNHKDDTSNEELHEFYVDETRSDFSPDAPITTSLIFDETNIKDDYEKSFNAMLQAMKRYHKKT
jgi:hypothetical protein